MASKKSAFPVGWAEKPRVFIGACRMAPTRNLWKIPVPGGPAVFAPCRLRALLIIVKNYQEDNRLLRLRACASLALTAPRADGGQPTGDRHEPIRHARGEQPGCAICRHQSVRLRPGVARGAAARGRCRRSRRAARAGPATGPD